MITLFKFLGITALIFISLRVLGELQIPPEIAEALTFVFSQAYKWNFLVDIDFLIIIAILVIHIEGLLLGWRVTRWLMEYIKHA